MGAFPLLIIPLRHISFNHFFETHNNRRYATKLSRLMENGRVVPFMRKDNASENGKNMVESKDIKDYNGGTAIDQSRAPGLAG